MHEYWCILTKSSKTEHGYKVLCLNKRGKFGSKIHSCTTQVFVIFVLEYFILNHAVTMVFRGTYKYFSSRNMSNQFCMTQWVDSTHDRFLSAKFVGRFYWPIKSIVNRLQNIKVSLQCSYFQIQFMQRLSTSPKIRTWSSPTQSIDYVYSQLLLNYGCVCDARISLQWPGIINSAHYSTWHLLLFLTCDVCLPGQAFGHPGHPSPHLSALSPREAPNKRKRRVRYDYKYTGDTANMY